MASDYKNNDFESLAGKLLVANPYCSFGDIFDKSIIYVASHTQYGSLGLIVNKNVNKFGLKKLYKINDKTIPEVEKEIMIGGPVEPDRSFVLHSSEYSKNIMFNKIGELAVSSNMEIIKDMLNGKGPKQASLILGYTGWGSGQLEDEIQKNYWLILDADLDIIFEEEGLFKWGNALEKIGIDNACFSSQMGHS